MRSILSTELMYGRVIPAAMPLTTTNTTTSTTLRPHHSLHPRTLYPDYALRSLPKVNLVFPNSLPPKVPMGYVDHNFWVINETQKKTTNKHHRRHNLLHGRSWTYKYLHGFFRVNEAALWFTNLRHTR